MSVLSMNKFGEIIECGFGEATRYKGRLKFSKALGILPCGLGEALDPNYDSWVGTQQVDWMTQHADKMRVEIAHLRSKIMNAIKSAEQKAEEKRIIDYYAIPSQALLQKIKDFENTVAVNATSMLPEDFKVYTTNVVIPEKARLQREAHEINEHRDTALLSIKPKTQIKLEQEWSDYDAAWLNKKNSTVAVIGDRVLKAAAFKVLWDELNRTFDQLEAYYKDITTPAVVPYTNDAETADMPSERIEQVVAQQTVQPEASPFSELPAFEVNYLQHPIFAFLQK